MELLLGKDEISIHNHLEDTPPGLDERHFDVGPFLLELGHQTGGPGLVVSDDAVFDRDCHEYPLRVKRCGRIVAPTTHPLKLVAVSACPWLGRFLFIGT